MLTKDDLKRILMLTHLTDAMLDRLATIVDVLKFEEEEFIFRAGEPAARFYMLRSGQVLLRRQCQRREGRTGVRARPERRFETRLPGRFASGRDES